MDRVETPTEELLRGIAKALEQEMCEQPRQAKLLGFVRDVCLDAYEQASGGDT